MESGGGEGVPMQMATKAQRGKEEGMEGMDESGGISRVPGPAGQFVPSMAPAPGHGWHSCAIGHTENNVFGDDEGGKEEEEEEEDELIF